MRHRPALHTTVAVSVVALLLAPGPAPAQKISNPDLFGKTLQAAAKALELYGTAEDREARVRVAEIGYRVAERANYTAFPFTFHVIDMPAPNAFALPGGQIFVTTGMLEMGLSDDMLAGLLGHEVAHVVHEHGTRMQRRATLLGVLSQALLVGVMVGANSGDAGNTRAPYDPRVRYPSPKADLIQGTAAAGVVVSELLLRGYSREFEREADDEGQRLAAAAGFSPEGLTELMRLMDVRLPQSKKYGYWQTHPFFEERVSAAETRGELISPQPGRPVDDFRQRTQAVLLTYLEAGDAPKDTGALLKAEALTAWPRGPAAEEIRLENLHRLRDAEMAEPVLSRDYGSLRKAYREELAEVERLDPESGLLPRLSSELERFEQEAEDNYPKAAAVLGEGVYETAFLETFLSNYPASPEVPEVALALGDAQSRLGHQTEAVDLYLQALEAAPDSPQGRRAREGLHNLAPVLDSLAALQQLASHDGDPQLQELARTRLDAIAGRFDSLAVGAEYLRRYPDGAYADQVTERLNTLADELYTEIVLYQGVGDSVKALDRINRIFTHAPASPAAERLREQAAVAEG